MANIIGLNVLRVLTKSPVFRSVNQLSRGDKNLELSLASTRAVNTSRVNLENGVQYVDFDLSRKSSTCMMDSDFNCLKIAFKFLPVVYGLGSVLKVRNHRNKKNRRVLTLFFPKFNFRIGSWMKALFQ